MDESLWQQIADEQGWTDTTLLDLALEYISNQQQDDAFTDFLRHHADVENDAGGLDSL